MRQSPEDPRILKAAHAALHDLPKRARDVLEHLLVNGGSAQTVAERNMIALGRADEWVDDARQRFRDRLELRLRRASVAEDQIRGLIEDPERLDQLAREAAQPVAPTLPHDPPAAALVGSRIGEYTLMQRLGEGGMGVVCRAAESAPPGGTLGERRMHQAPGRRRRSR